MKKPALPIIRHILYPSSHSLQPPVSHEESATLVIDQQGGTTNGVGLTASKAIEAVINTFEEAKANDARAHGRGSSNRLRQL